MTPEQTQAKTFLTTDTHTYTDIAGSYPVNQWYSLGADTQCIALMNSQAFGAALSKTVPRKTVSGGDVIAAIGNSADFAGMDSTTLTKLQWLIQKDPVQIGDATTAAAIDNALGAYSSAKAAFDGLKTRASSVWESITGIDGAQFTQADLSEIRAS
jgi:hypothetical protein